MPQGAWKERLAAHVVSLLPDDNTDARQVLDHARRLIDVPFKVESDDAANQIRLVSDNPPESEAID